VAVMIIIKPHQAKGSQDKLQALKKHQRKQVEMPLMILRMTYLFRIYLKIKMLQLKASNAGF